MRRTLIYIIIAIFYLNEIFAQTQHSPPRIIYPWHIRTGADQTELYLPLLKGKKIAVVANISSVIKNTNLVDTLVSLKIDIKKILCPEHGFRKDAEAGELIKSHEDKQTGIKILSLYGDNKKPKPEDLKDIDIVVYDLQDVGVRFYTYISTLQYVMEACAENNKEVLILDRPNPNGYYVDGPVLEKECSSFVGMTTIPVVYGMTPAEYALMLNGEGWLKNKLKCKLNYISIKNYTHKDYYQLPLSPSPNLPNMESIYLYPSLGLFEGTVISVGRGTDLPFQVIGHPNLDASFSFTPVSIPGKSLKPPFQNIVCNGYNLKNYAMSYIMNCRKLYLFWLLETYSLLKNKTNYFNDYFDKLAGTKTLRKQIEEGKTEEEIRNSWKQDIEKFKSIRKRYLLYTDFE